MGEIQQLSQSSLTTTLAQCLRGMWDAYQRIDAETHGQYLTRDYRAVHPDGTVHVGQPGVADIAAAPIESYRLNDLQAWPVGQEAAIATYTAEVQVRTALATSQRFQFEVGEVWVKHGNHWKCRYYHATLRR